MTKQYLEQVQELRQRCKDESMIPQETGMVTVKSLLSPAELLQFRKTEYRDAPLATVFVDIRDQIFSVRPEQLVPQDTKILHDLNDESRLVGLPVVVSG